MNFYPFEEGTKDMSFRTLTSLAILALVVIVAVNMNRQELEQEVAMGSPDEIATPMEEGMEIDRTPAEEVPGSDMITDDDEAMTTGNGTVTPDEISNEPIPAPSTEKSPMTEEVLDDEPAEREYDQEGHPAPVDENRAQAEQSPKG